MVPPSEIDALGLENRCVAKGFTEFFGWSLFALADLAAIDHYVMLVGGPVDAD